MAIPSDARRQSCAGSGRQMSMTRPGPTIVPGLGGSNGERGAPTGVLTTVTSTQRWPGAQLRALPHSARHVWSMQMSPSLQSLPSGGEQYSPSAIRDA